MLNNKNIKNTLITPIFMKVAYLGPAKTYTQRVAKELYPDEELIPMKPIIRIVKAVESKEVDFGIVPLENFYEGEVRETLDAISESKTFIIKEKAIEITHCLGVLPDNKKINKIFSKDQALGQCGKYIYENYPNAITIATSSTSEAVEKIAKEKLIDSAAIASEEALKNSGLKIIARDLCKNNKTKFAVLGTEKTKQTGNDKTFLVFHQASKDKPGILQESLGFFSNLGINLEYIQSRPDKKAGYYFYIELDGHETDEKVKTALQALKHSLDQDNKNPNSLRILGSYPKIDWK
jgi:prephenate dehydratase